VFVFPLYVLTVWLLVAKWRRSWIGALILVAGTTGTFALWMFYRTIVQWFGNTVPLENARVVIWGTGGLASIVGLYIFLLPRRAQIGHCRHCGYDLRGHEETKVTCPECGKAAGAT
jgi:hypothetical protein